MISNEHKKAFMAFVVVAGVAALIMANGLRAQAVEVLIEVRAPRPLISALAPDMVLGRTFDRNNTFSAAAETPGTTRLVASAPAGPAVSVRPVAAPAPRVSLPAAAHAAKSTASKSAGVRARPATAAARPVTGSGGKTPAVNKPSTGANLRSGHAKGQLRDTAPQLTRLADAKRHGKPVSRAIRAARADRAPLARGKGVAAAARLKH